MMKFLGIDYGEKRIGLAIGDDEMKVATPLATVGSIDEIRKIIKKEKVDKIIIGLPKGLGGQDTAQTREIREFAKEFKKLEKLKKFKKIEFIDERFTTKMAVGDKDQSAAAIILQTYLNMLE